MWEYQGLTPSEGKIYHKGRQIKHIYSTGDEIIERIYTIPEGLPMLACFGSGNKIEIRRIEYEI